VIGQKLEQLQPDEDRPLTELDLKSIINVKAVLVCICHPTSDRDLDAVIDDGARTLQEIGQRCGAGTGCGACVDDLRDRLVSRGANGCPRDCASDLVSLRSSR
jgi:bacterioferritin-associated ferredoxin